MCVVQTQKCFKYTHHRLAPAYRSAMTLLGPEIIIKMGLELFRKVPAGTIEMHFDEQNQPLFKRADLGRYLGIRNIRDNFKEFLLHHAHPRSEIEGGGVTNNLGREKILMISSLIWIVQLKLLFALKNPRQLFL